VAVQTGFCGADEDLLHGQLSVSNTLDLTVGPTG